MSLTVNGERREAAVPVHRTLLEVLREDLGLPGTKHGCELGECGACTVLVDGEAVASCLVPVGQLEDRRVATVESLGRPERLSPLQQCFLDEGAAQCGICTPGMLMAASAYVLRGGVPDAAAIRRELAGNLCRCTGYQHIVRAVQKAARLARRGDAPSAGKPRPARAGARRRSERTRRA
jgi:carbon-monoxide dehydrogenase small subunit